MATCVLLWVQFKYSYFIGCTGVETTDQVEAMFDSITYDKGASVLRMLRAYLTRDLVPQPLLRRALLQVRNLATLPPRLCELVLNVA